MVKGSTGAKIGLIAGGLLAGGILIYAVAKNAGGIAKFVGDLGASVGAQILGGITGGGSSSGGGGQVSPPAGPNQFLTPNTFGPGTPNPISQTIQAPPPGTPPGTYPVQGLTQLPPNPYVAKGPYTIPTFLSIAAAQGQPASFQVGSSGGSLLVAARASGQDLSNLLTIRGKPLSKTLSVRSDVVAGVISTKTGGTREIAGSVGLFQRLGQNLGVAP